jgi:pyruvate dehydrogenase E1 component alpha subunit
MLNERVDGMDVLAVHDAAKKAIAYVRKQGKPYLLEAVTYRFRGHSMGDPERYRTQAEVRKWQDTDPIGMYRNALMKRKISKATLDELETRAREEVVKAVEFAEASPEPGLEELFTDVYVDA